jgi:hypothetical protein
MERRFQSDGRSHLRAFSPYVCVMTQLHVTVLPHFVHNSTLPSLNSVHDSQPICAKASVPENVERRNAERRI